MPKRPDTYPIEKEAERFLREAGLFIKKAGNFLFTIPKRKDERMIHLIEFIAIMTLLIAFIWRVGNL